MAAIYFRLQTIIGRLLLTWCIFNFVGHTDAFEKWVSISGDRTVGGDAYIACNIITLPGEAVINTKISLIPHDETNHFYEVYTAVDFPALGPRHHNRLSITINRTGNVGTRYFTETSTMRISNLQCGDEGEYGCVFAYGVPRKQVVLYTVSSYLFVKINPEAPVLTIEPQSVHPAKDSIFLYEKSTVTATCSANLGTPRLGRLDWRIYIQDNPEYIDRTDPRIQPLEKVALLPSDPDCTERVRQQLVVKTDQTEQEMVILCLVHNSDFQNPTDRHCSDPTKDVCVQSPPIFFISRSDNTNVLVALAIAFLAIVAGIAVVLLFEKFLLSLCEKPTSPPRKKIVSQQRLSPFPIQRPVYVPSLEYTDEEERIEDFSDESDTDKESVV